MSDAAINSVYCISVSSIRADSKCSLVRSFLSESVSPHRQLDSANLLLCFT